SPGTGALRPRASTRPTPGASATVTDEPGPALPTPPPTPSPFAPGAPGGNSGPATPPLSPTPVPGSPSTNPPNSSDNTRPQARNHKWAPGARLAAFQESGIPAPAPPPQPRDTQNEPRRDLPTPPIGTDPNPVNIDLSQPANPRPDLTPDQYRASEAI